MAVWFPIAVIIGYMWALAVGGPLISRVMRAIRRVSADREPQLTLLSLPEPEWHRAAFSIVERSLFVTAVLADRPEIIGAWLVLKVATRWGAWEDVPGIFNRWATGTGLSLAFGASGGALAWALSEPESWLLVLGLAAGPLLLAGIVWLMYTDRFAMLREWL